MINPELIIFDFDGTLVDSEDINNKANSSVLLEYGYEKFTPEYCAHRFIGCSIKDIIDILKSLKIDNYKELLDLMHKRSLDIAGKELKLIENVEYILHRIDKPMCVASNGEREIVAEYTKITGLNKFFPSEHIFTRECVEHPKPAPDLYLYAADKMGKYDPKKCFVIEDSVAGVTAASKAGMRVVGFTGGKHHNDNTIRPLLEAGAFATISDISDIFKYI